MSDKLPTRRTVLTAGALGVGAFALAACAPKDSQNNQSSGSSENQQSTPSSKGKTQTIALSSVPLGETILVSVSGIPVAVTQPQAGQIQAFQAICTHEGCSVMPREKKLFCPCHSAEFDPESGKAIVGPAREPLKTVDAVINGQNITLTV